MALLSEMATVEFDEDLTDTDTLVKEIASLGFDVKLTSITTKTEVSTAKFKVCIYVCTYVMRRVLIPTEQKTFTHVGCMCMLQQRPRYCRGSFFPFIVSIIINNF